MASTPKLLIPPKLAEAAQTAQYTAQDCKTIIGKFTVSNTSAVNAVFSCNLVTSLDTAGAQNLTLPPRTIAPGESYSAVELVGQILEPGGFISTLAGTAGVLSIRASGTEIT